MICNIYCIICHIQPLVCNDQKQHISIVCSTALFSLPFLLLLLLLLLLLFSLVLVLLLAWMFLLLLLLLLPTYIYICVYVCVYIYIHTGNPYIPPKYLAVMNPGGCSIAGSWNLPDQSERMRGEGLDQPRGRAPVERYLGSKRSHKHKNVVYNR